VDEYETFIFNNINDSSTCDNQKIEYISVSQSIQSKNQPISSLYNMNNVDLNDFADDDFTDLAQVTETIMEK
jgi:hypothetical protein